MRQGGQRVRLAEGSLERLHCGRRGLRAGRGNTRIAEVGVAFQHCTFDVS